MCQTQDVGIKIEKLSKYFEDYHTSIYVPKCKSIAVALSFGVSWYNLTNIMIFLFLCLLISLLYIYVDPVSWWYYIYVV